MPMSISSPTKPMRLRVAPLIQSTFAPFGTVIENPAPDLVQSSQLRSASSTNVSGSKSFATSVLPEGAVLANQGSAIKYLDVTNMRNLYGEAPSGKQGTAVMNMFVCAPRRLTLPHSAPLDQNGGDMLDAKNAQNGNYGVEGLFPVEILERHPFTTQTFIPMGLSAKERFTNRYLVIVAPTLPATEQDAEFAVPEPRAQRSSSAARTTSGIAGIRNNNLPGRGRPDLTKLRAFIASGAQAVTYGAGTWHAPMVALGGKSIVFVVVQFANGVAAEDCQEVVFASDGVLQEGICVEIPEEAKGRLWSKL